MKVRVLCPACAWRYAGVVHPNCDWCLGKGLIIAVVPEGIDPWVAARAVTMQRSLSETREAKVKAGLVSDDPTGAVGLDIDPPDHTARQRVGVAAGKLLVAMKVRTPTKRKAPVRKSREEREAQKAQKAALAATEAEWRAKAHQRQREREQKAKEDRALAAVVDVLKAEDPDRFDDLLKSELVLVTLSDLPDIRTRPPNTNAVIARRAAESGP